VVLIFCVRQLGEEPAREECNVVPLLAGMTWPLSRLERRTSLFAWVRRCSWRSDICRGRSSTSGSAVRALRLLAWARRSGPGAERSRAMS